MPFVKVSLLAVVIALFPFHIVVCQAVKLADINRAAVPPAMAGDLISNVHFTVSPAQDYALCYTEKEARVWRLPDGELIYRFQDSKDKTNIKDGTSGRIIRDVRVTGDKKYICVYDNALLQAAEIESGELVPDGLVLDSLRAGSYNTSRGFDEQGNFARGRFLDVTAPLRVVRKDYRAKKSGEKIEIIEVLNDPLHAGSLLVFYKQEYCGSDEWIKTHDTRSISEVRKSEDKDNRCQYFDYHISRYETATKTVTYLGNFMDRTAGPYERVRAVFPAPFEEMVIVGAEPKDPLTAYDYSGKVMWRSERPWTDLWITGFDQAGNIVLKEDWNGAQIRSLRSALTGKVISAYEVPPGNKDLTLINRWQMMADVQKNASGDYTIALYDMKSGGLVKALTDAESATAFSRAFREQSDRYNRAVAEVNRLRAIERQQEEAANQRRINESSARAAEHAKHWKTCDVCDGAGYTTKTGYSSGSSKTTEGTRRNTITGEVSVYSETVTTPGGAYSTTVSCRKCHGKGEVPRGY